MIADDSLFNRYTPCAALVDPTATLPKFSAETESVVARTPEALSGTDSGLLLAVLWTVSVPAPTAPKAVGFTVTPILQLDPAAKTVEFEHGDEGAVARAYGGLGKTWIVVMWIEVVPEFLKVTTWIALVWLTATLPKFTDVGDTVDCPHATLPVNRHIVAVKNIRNAD